MYPNLEAEMTRSSVTRRDLAETIGKTYNTVRTKLNGKMQFTLKEAKEIKKEFFPNLSLDYLFEEKEA